MTSKMIEKASAKHSDAKKLTALVLLLTLICICIFVIRSCSVKESEYVDRIAGQIEQEMVENRFVLSKSGGRRTVVDFQEPIILAHSKESQLIVHTAHLTETITVSIEGLGGWDWTSIHQDVEYKGEACNPEIPVAPGEEHWLLDTSLDEVYWPCSHSRAIPSFPSQLEWKIGLAWANTRGSLNSPS